MDKYYKNSIRNIKDYADKLGFKVVFRDSPNNCGDFCFFIYKKGVIGQRYLVGFDGYWDATGSDPCSFDSCWEAVHQYIIQHRK